MVSKINIEYLRVMGNIVALQSNINEVASARVGTSGVRLGLDSKIKARRSIGSRLNDAVNSAENIQQRLRAAQHVIEDGAALYQKTESRILQHSRKLAASTRSMAIQKGRMETISRPWTIAKQGKIKAIPLLSMPFIAWKKGKRRLKLKLKYPGKIIPIIPPRPNPGPRPEDIKIRDFIRESDKTDTNGTVVSGVAPVTPATPSTGTGTTTSGAGTTGGSGNYSDFNVIPGYDQYLMGQREMCPSLGGSGSGNYACSITAEAMAVSIYTGSRYEPNVSTNWSSGCLFKNCTNVSVSGYNERLQYMYNSVLDGVPVVFRVSNNNNPNDAHFLTAVGVRDGADPNSLSTSDILILEPWTASVMTLAEYEAGGVSLGRTFAGDTRNLLVPNGNRV